MLRVHSLRRCYLHTTLGRAQKAEGAILQYGLAASVEQLQKNTADVPKLPVACSTSQRALNLSKLHDLQLFAGQGSNVLGALLRNTLVCRLVRLVLTTLYYPLVLRAKIGKSNAGS